MTGKRESVIFAMTHRHTTGLCPQPTSAEEKVKEGCFFPLKYMFHIYQSKNVLVWGEKDETKGTRIEGPEKKGL